MKVASAVLAIVLSGCTSANSCGGNGSGSETLACRQQPVGAACCTSAGRQCGDGYWGDAVACEGAFFTIMPDCGGFHAGRSATDQASYYWLYDGQSGRLLATFDVGESGWTCNSGPSSIEVSSECKSLWNSSLGVACTPDSRQPAPAPPFLCESIDGGSAEEDGGIQGSDASPTD